MRLAIVLSVLATSMPAAAKKYTQQDLAALVAQEHWTEAVEHLTDVAPAKRDKAWSAVSEKVAVGFFTASAKEQDPVTTFFVGEELIKRVPALKKSKPVMQKRAEVGLAAFTRCFQGTYDGQECMERIVRFVDVDPSDAELALNAGKVVRQGMNAYAAAPLFRRAAAKLPSACQDEDLILSVIAALGLPADNPLYKDGLLVADKSCFEALRPKISTELAAQESGYFVDNACKLLLEKKAATAEVQTKCAKK